MEARSVNADSAVKVSGHREGQLAGRIDEFGRFDNFAQGDG